ncbi:MAG TPA: folate-binding protein [Gammaproteobacteria bacterium]|nr:folate-binding protein [Gammaproteobacteria bacterium]
MKQDWNNFLAHSGAEYKDGILISFGNPVRELKLASNGDILTDLSFTGLIAIRGDDAEQFLQGQFTNDIRDVDDKHTQLSGYCSPKGRLLSNFLIFRHQDSYFLRLPKALIEETVKRLKMFVLMSKVVIEDISESQIHIGYSGPNAEKELSDQPGDVPTEHFSSCHEDELTIIRLPGKNPRFEILGPMEKIIGLWKALDVRGTPVGPEVWSWLSIQNGLPLITPSTVDAFVPQMINMQLINGVSFKKGCYTGQEIVARMQYLGKLKRRMYLAHVDCMERPNEGDALFSASSRSGQGAGKIVNVSASPDGGFDLLAVIEISAVKSDTIHLTDRSGPELGFMDLPYPFESEEKT